MRKVLVIGLTVAAALAATASSAFASKATALVEHEGHCGIEGPEPFIGVAKFTRVGNSVTVAYKLTNGLPKTIYEVTLWNTTGLGTGCEDLGAPINAKTGKPAKFKTGATGKGGTTGVIVVPTGDTEFFLTGFDATNGYNDSLRVFLP
jgi:hypothetical protein